MFQSVLWDFIGKFLNQLSAFVISVVLARLLLPSEFGLFGIVLVFITFSGVLFDFGFRNAIINQKDISDTALSTILYINLAVATLISTIFFFSAGAIAAFYHEPLLEKLLKVATVTFIINAASIVPTALNQKKLKFRANAIIITVATILSGLVSIWMAYTGWGVWSILWRSVIQALTVCCLSWFICSWMPKVVINISSIKPLLAYSSTLFFTVVLDSLFQRADVLVIGKKYSSSTLGFYTRAQTLEGLSRELLSGIMYSVFFPYFSKIKDDLNEVKVLYTNCLHVVSFIIVFINGMLFLNGKQVITFLFTSKWIDSIPFFKFFLVIGVFFTMNVVMGILLASTGKHKLFLRVELLKKLLLLPIYLFGFLGNIQVLLFALLTGYVLMLFLNMVYVHKAIGFSLVKQLAIIFRYLLPSTISVMICWFIFDKWNNNLFIHIAVVSTAYMLLNIPLNMVLKNKAVELLYAKLSSNFLLPKMRR